VLLITAMLIIPAAAARRFASGPEQMALLAAVIGVGGGHSVASSDRWNGTRLPARASWSQRWACLCSILSLFPVYFAQESPDRGAGEERERTPERSPAMNEHVHEPVDLTKNQSLVMGALTNSERAAERLHHSRPASRQRVSRASPGLPGAGQAGGVRLVHRLESLNAFVACRHPGCDGDKTIAFMICERCGQVNEITDNALAKRLKQLAGDASFALKKTTIELRGICHTCQVA
jgi:Fur family zinc uptake transcriptional regulator